MDLLNGALQPDVLDLDAVASPEVSLAWRLRPGDPSTSPFAAPADDDALADAGEALDRAIFGALLYV
jgi:hypothetical protein